MKFLIENPLCFAFEHETSMLSNKDWEIMVCEPNMACFCWAFKLSGFYI